MILWKLIKEHLLLNSQQHICENKAVMSYEDIAIWAETFAAKLQGVRCCAILCSSEMTNAMVLLACFAAEVTAVPLSLKYGESHCNKILETISPDAIVMDVNNEIVVYKIKDNNYISPKEHPALIMCTSGTLGIPKGVMLSEKNIITNVSDISKYFSINKNDTILIARPLYHCAVLTGEFLVAIVNGSNILFYSEEFNPAKIIEIIRNQSITSFCATPTLLSLMARFNRRSCLPTLKHVCISGECMSSETGLMIASAFPNCKIYHVYGLTEACPRVSFLPPDFFHDYPDCVGIPLNSVSIKILNSSGEICKRNEEGILYVKGDNIMMGYYKEPEKTHKVLKEGWLCTGDVALINDVGFLKIKGRNDDLIIKAGMNIYPTEIEETLKKDSRVKEVFVYGFYDHICMQIGMKIVGDFSSVEEVRRLCLLHLPYFQIPSNIEILNELPKTGSGKIKRKVHL